MKTLSLFVVVVVVALKWTAGYVTNDDDDDDVDVWQAPSYLAQVDAQFCLPYSPPSCCPPPSPARLHRIWFAVGGSRRRVSCIMDND